MILQPNSWSCLPTAFCNAFSYDYDDIIKAVGHDGSEIVDPTMPDPYRRKAIHPEELIRVFFKRNKAIITFEAEPTFNDNIIRLDRDNFYECISWFNRGVITGNYCTKDHAFTLFNHCTEVHDPANGQIFKFEDMIKLSTFKPYFFYGLV